MKKTSITIAIFIDALGWRLAQENGFLQRELPYRGPLATTFGYSATCDPTILTGVAPRQHGHFAFFTYDPERSPFRQLAWLRWLPDFLVGRGRVRRWVSRLVQRMVGYTGYFQLYNTPFRLLPQMDYTEKRDLYRPGGINGGQSTLFDELREAGVPFHVSDWRKPETANLAAVERDLKTGIPEFAYVFLAELDAILHAKGTASAAVAKKLGWYEEQVRNLLATAREHYDEVTVALFSDHGMTDVTHECDLMRQVEALGLKFGEDYFAVYDSTMARFWFLNEWAERRIVAALEGHRDGSWLSQATLQQWGCDFADRRYGHKFFLLRPGILLNPSFMGRAPLAGMHGYDPWHRDSIAYFATNNPRLARPSGLANLREVLMESVGVRIAAGNAA